MALPSTPKKASNSELISSFATLCENLPLPDRSITQKPEFTTLITQVRTVQEAVSPFIKQDAQFSEATSKHTFSSASSIPTDFSAAWNKQQPEFLKAISVQIENRSWSEAAQKAEITPNLQKIKQLTTDYLNAIEMSTPKKTVSFRATKASAGWTFGRICATTLKLGAFAAALFAIGVGLHKNYCQDSTYSKTCKEWQTFVLGHINSLSPEAAKWLNRDWAKQATDLTEAVLAWGQEAYQTARKAFG